MTTHTTIHLKIKSIKKTTTENIITIHSQHTNYFPIQMPHKMNVIAIKEATEQSGNIDHDD